MDATFFNPGRYLPILLKPSGNEKESLTEKEREAYDALGKVPHQSIIGHCIRETLREGSVKQFRRMIKELKEQAIQAPEGLKRAIGKEAFEILKQL